MNNNWPKWIPNPNSWMSALLLILLVRGLAVVVRLIIQMGGSAMEISPKVKILLYLAALLSPIGVVAVAHHWLHRILDRYFPNTRSPEMRGTQGLFPGILSWWEGLYGWLAIALAFVASSIIEVLFSPSYNSLYDTLAWWEELKDLFTLPTLYRLIAAAYLYQFEQGVRHHLISVGAAAQSEPE